jgi:CDP-6-deoxy-D-xylo-4-hexulose-3-dehydrase
MEKEKIVEEIHNLIREYFLIEKEEFVPNETIIPIAAAPYSSEEVNEAVDSLLSTWVSMGKKVEEFEKEYAKYIGVKYAIMVNSGSSANLLSLAILTNASLKNKLNPGDEIITPALTWATTVYPIVNNGLVPVFVDVDEKSFEIDVNQIESAISPKTKAIMPVHLLGNPVNITKIKEIADKNNLIVIEDSCEAHGAEVNGKKIGSFGDMSTFSFFLSHHITTIEGGMLLTNNEEYYEIGKALRAFGWIRDLKNKSEISKKNSKLDPRFLFVNMGFNIRPTEIQGAFGIHQIKKLEHFIKIRQDNTSYWNQVLSKFSNFIQLPTEKENTRHVYFGYAILIKENAPFSYQEFVSYLESKKIETRPIMSGNMVEQPSSSLYEYRVSGELNNASKIMHNAVFIPNHQEIGIKEREFIASTITEFIESNQ